MMRPKRQQPIEVVLDPGTSDEADPGVSDTQARPRRQTGGAGGEPPGMGYDYGGYTSAAVELSGAGSSMLDLRNLISILRRRKFLILGLVLLAVVGAMLYTSQLTPLYQAQATIVIEPDRTRVLKVDAVVSDMPGDMLTIQTEVAKMGSLTVALRVVDLLKLGDDPRFNPNLAPPPAEQGFSFSGLLDDTLVTLGLSEPAAKAAPVTPQPAPTAQVQDSEKLREMMAARFMGGLSVQTAERSRIVTIAYISTDPAFAAKAANAVALAYIEGQLERIGGETSHAGAVVTEKLGDLEKELIDAERRLEAYRAEHGLTEVSGVSLQSQQLVSLNSDLIAARNDLTEKQVRYDQVQRLMKGGGGSVEAAAAIMDSTMIQGLQLQAIELNREVAELSAKYRDGHPKMIEARAKQKEVQAKIWSEIRKTEGLLENELEIARGRVENLTNEVERLKGEIADLGEFQVQLSALSAEVDAKRKQYDSLLQRSNEIAVQEGSSINKPDAEIIARAEPPGGPVYPRTKVIIGMAAAAAVVLGLVMALGLEFLDSGYRSLGTIEAQTGLATLGMIPMISLRGRSSLPHHHATAKHGSIFAEAIRTVRTNLMLSNPEQPPRIVVVTSSMPNEGKTTTVLSIASQTVQTGRRCIVVDCDMRQAQVGSSLGHSKQLGLSDFLANAADLGQIIGVDERTGIHFIGAGTLANPPVEMLGSARMQNLINALAQSYHLVVLDTPPLLAVSDALVLLREADSTVFLIRWGKTPRETAKLGLKVALEAGASIAGVLLTYVDVKKHAQYTYADSGRYYNKAYRKYYYTK
jgi:capsular exopolysaccharide synthesis family protein